MSGVRGAVNGRQGGTSISFGVFVFVARRRLMTDEERVRAAAHKIWQEVGQPTDQANLHWEMAKQEIEDETRAEAPPSEIEPSAVLPILKTAPIV
jgi:hypothetical protein